MKKILFVCHGNICRSVMAEMIFKHMARENGLIIADSIFDESGDYYVDSCATSTEEIGNDIYPPAKRCLHAHHIPFTKHAARQITPVDYDCFDRIYCMEQYNIRNLRYTLGLERIQEDALSPSPKISLLLPRDVADPWYTGDFETAYNDIAEGCRNILDNQKDI